MHVFQTAGVPPKSGSTILANIGWTRKSSVALRKRVAAKAKGSASGPTPLPGAAGRPAASGVALVFIRSTDMNALLPDAVAQTSTTAAKGGLRGKARKTKLMA